MATLKTLEQAVTRIVDHLPDHSAADRELKADVHAILGHDDGDGDGDGNGDGDGGTPAE